MNRIEIGDCRDITEAALYIADRASMEMIESEGVRSDHVTYTFSMEVLEAEPLLSEAIDYAEARGFCRVDQAPHEVIVTVLDPAT